MADLTPCEALAAPRPGDVIAERVRTYRIRRGWSFPRLADECARLGAPQLTVPSLTNIERGQRDDAKRGRRGVPLDEVAVLARALGVPPVLLLLPLGTESAVQLLPGVAVPTWDAFRWWIGERGFPGDSAGPSANGDAPGAEILGYFRDHDKYVRTGQDALLRDLRKHMQRAGVLPPDLPAD